MDEVRRIACAERKCGRYINHFTLEDNTHTTSSGILPSDPNRALHSVPESQAFAYLIRKLQPSPWTWWETFAGPGPGCCR